MKVVFSATLDKLMTLKDKSLKVTIQTQELTPDIASKLLQLNGSFMKVLFSSENVITNREIEEVDSVILEEETTGKSPSQRFRNVLYRLWEQESEGYQDFNIYYVYKMEKLINHYKEKLS